MELGSKGGKKEDKVCVLNLCCSKFVLSTHLESSIYKLVLQVDKLYVC